jgi:hypothetical protein
MAPSAVDSRGVMVNGINGDHGGKVKSRSPHDEVHFDPSLKPKDYTIKGTDPNSKVLFRDVNILDSTGADPFRGSVYIEGGLIANARVGVGSSVTQANGSSTLARYLMRKS